MDFRLEERLTKINEQIIELRVVEEKYLFLEAHKKVLFSQLFLKSSGANIAEREAKVYASDDWINFSTGHVEAEASFNEARRKYELKLKAYDAEHLTMKTEGSAIQRHGGA